MSPAFDAATHTTVPTVRIAARADGSVHPRSTNTAETPRRVTSVIAEVGFDETPISPTMREETTKKHTPKIATPSALTRRGPKDMLPARRPGTATSVMTTRAGTSATKIGGMSRSVRPSDVGPTLESALSDWRVGPTPPRRPFTTALNELHIVGSARATATIPAAATAPAP